MATQQVSQPGNPEPSTHTAEPRIRWGRSLAIATAIVFCITSAFPAVAAFVHDTESWPKWWGALDVSIAFLLGLMPLAVMGIAQGKINKHAEDATYASTGFAWRTWLLFYGLPAWFALVGCRHGEPA